jgi:hypothetical protein
VLDEVVDARTYGGMHYRFSSEVGAVIGRKAAARAARTFRPARGHHHDDGGDDDEEDCDRH